MQRIALHSEIRAGSADDYVREHARVPDDLIDAFSRVGIHEWTIWRSGHRMFHLVVADDFDAAIAALDDESANRSWQQMIGPLVELYRNGDGGAEFAPLGEVWDLGRQRGDG